MTAWISIIAGLIPVLAFVIKYFLSEDAQKKAQEAQFQKDSAAHSAALDQKVDANAQSQPAQSQSAGSAWDAADAVMRK